MYQAEVTNEKETLTSVFYIVLGESWVTVSKTQKIDLVLIEPMNNPLSVSPRKGNQGTRRGKEKIF